MRDNEVLIFVTHLIVCVKQVDELKSHVVNRQLWANDFLKNHQGDPAAPDSISRIACPTFGFNLHDVVDVRFLLPSAFFIFIDLFPSVIMPSFSVGRFSLISLIVNAFSPCALLHHALGMGVWDAVTLDHLWEHTAWRISGDVI